jgi:hypothetical protein
MSVEKRILSAIIAMNQGDYEKAVYEVVSAIDATAKKETLINENKKRYTTWLQANRDIITRTGFLMLEIQGEMSFPVINEKGDAVQLNFEEVIYKLVRCSLIHEAEIAKGFILTERQLGMDDSGRILVPRGIAFGLVMAVIGSKVNSGKRLTQNFSFKLGDRTFFYNDLWGKKPVILARFREESKRHS